MTPIQIVDDAHIPVPFVNGEHLLVEGRGYEVLAPRGQITLDGVPWTSDARFKLPLCVGVAELQVASTKTQVRVLPNPRKLSAQAWLLMLEDIECLAARLLTGAGAVRHGDVSHAGVAAPFLAEALLPLIPELERAFATVARRPRVLVRQELAEDPAHLVRRTTRALATRIAQRPGLRQQPEATLPNQRTSDSLDHPANSYVTWLMKRVARVLQSTADALLAGNDESEGAVRCRLRGEACARGARRLTAILRRSTLRNVRSRPLEESALLTVRDDPGYARMHRLGRRFLSPLFRLTPGPLPSPAPPSYELYELWTFLRVWSAIGDALGDDWRWDVSILDDPASFARVGEGTGVTARNEKGDEVRVLFNPTFACRLADPSGDRIGLTGERRPDVVVTYTRASARTGAWIAFDAKYRVGREALAQEFATAHVYRDALRWASYGGQCCACLLLAPVEVSECAPWFSDEFRSTHGFGVAVLTPGERDALVRLARWTLDRLTGQGCVHPMRDRRGRGAHSARHVSKEG